MLCEITLGPGYLRAELFERRTAQDTRDALATIAAEARRRGCARVLVSVHASRPIFKVEQSGLLDVLREIGWASRHRIALTGDAEELRLSHQYVEILARRAGINVRSFANEGAALAWLRDRRWLPDRRLRRGPWKALERRGSPPRRGPEGLAPA